MANKRLLVADDSLTIQKVIRLALANEGFEIQTVSDGKETLEQLSLFRPDILLVDISLPQKDAFQLKREMNEIEDMSKVRVVLMSSAFEQVDEGLVSEVHFHGRLVKPFDPAHLRKVLKEVLEVDTNVTEPVGTGEATGVETLAFKTPEETATDISQIKPPPFKFPPPPDTGADHFQWSVNESALKKIQEPKTSVVGDKTFAQIQIHQPTLKPTPNMMDTEGATISLDKSKEDSTTKGDAASIYHSAPDSDTEDSFENTTPSSVPIQVDEKTPPPISIEPTGDDIQATRPPQNVMPLSTDQMERIIKDQLQDTIQNMAREMFPDIAEKIIKDEIHRLLANPPQGKS